MNTLSCIVLAGVGATALMDVWSMARRRWLGIPAPDYGLVGRWIGYMPRRKFRHAAIKAATPLRGEAVIGWTAHYLIGIAFAAMLPALWGSEWFRNPSLLPALLVGVATVAAPFLVMQPGMGAGFAASRSPRPMHARLHSLLTHAIFGVGLFASGWAVSQLLTS